MPWLLLLIGIAVYANSIGGTWVYDDLNAIVGNPHIRSLAPPWSPAGDNPLSGRPVVGLTMAVNYALGELNGRGYHAVNIAVHLMCALVLYGVIKRTLSGPGVGEPFAHAAGGIAFACALVWMVHPIQTECVNYTTQRTESIMALFYLLTLYCAIRAWPGEGGGGRAWMVAAVVACGLGMASKESMVTAPVMVVLYDWAYHRKPNGGSMGQTVGRLLRKRAALYGGLAATWVILAALMITGPRVTTVGFDHGISAWTYALNQCIALTDYLRLVVWPTPLVLDYGVPRPLTLTQAAPYAVVLAGLLVTTAVLFLRRPVLGYPAVWFFALLAPTSTIVPIATEVAAERRLYLPLAGLIVLAATLAWMGLVVATNRSSRAEHVARSLRARLGAAVLIVAALPLMAATRVRNAQYRTPVELWQGSADANPLNHRAFMNLGVVLAGEGRVEEAIAQYRRSLELESGSSMTHYNLGNALFTIGRLDEAAGCFRAAVAASPEETKPHYNLAMTLIRMGRMDDEVIREFGAVVEIAPDNGMAQWGLARALSTNRRGPEALIHMRESVRLMPGRPETLRDAAWMMATYPDPAVRDGAEAMRLARRASELTGGNDPLTLDVLAAAYAEADDFEQAVATARRALIAAEDNPTLAAQIRSRLALYLQGRAYRVP